MPEGPEVRRQADRIRAALAGGRVERVVFGLPRLAEEGPRLSGRRVEGVASRGKALLVAFEGGRVVYSHNQLYGRWYVVPAGRPPRTQRQLRLGLEGERQWALLYSASEIDVLDAAELAAHPFLSKLGPDALDPDVTPADVLRRLEAPGFRGRNLGALLLDQGFVAGLGNYLRSEILYEAGILAAHRPKDLSPARRARLAEAILEITRRSYASGGLTVEPELAARLAREGLSRRQRRHHVFGRAGQTCRRCATPIERAEAAGRRVYACPGCQL